MPRFATTVITPALGACTTARGGRIDLITWWAPPEPADDFDAFITPDPRLPGTKRGNSRARDGSASARLLRNHP